MTARRPLCDEPLVPILALGNLPLANALVSEAALSDPEPRFPLTLALCEPLALVQLVERVPPQDLFREYIYFTSVAAGAVRHAKAIADRMIQARKLNRESLVVEIASNDGYLLQHYKARDIPVLGIEPAANVARVAEADRGIPTLSTFFDEALGASLASEGRSAAVIHANNVFAHVPDPVGFLRGIALLLAADGIAIIEVPYVKDMLDLVAFDTIYHEHVFYYSLTSVSRLCERAGLYVLDVERLTVHGGSLRIFLSRAGRATASEAVASLLAEEARWGVQERSAYATFAGQVEALRIELRRTLIGAKRAGRTIAAYGASAKGTTLLNYCGIGRDLVDFVVDKSPHKQGLYTPGTHLPILPPNALAERRPELVLLLAWNLAEEILQQESEYRGAGGKFIIPVPHVRLV
jgi:SAM-dependent methyltransferase